MLLRQYRLARVRGIKPKRVNALVVDAKYALSFSLSILERGGNGTRPVLTPVEPRAGLLLPCGNLARHEIACRKRAVLDLKKKEVEQKSEEKELTFRHIDLLFVG